MNGAVGLWVRRDWRRRWRSLVALAVLTGIAFGVGWAAVAGARRTASSFERMREETLAYDYGVVVQGVFDCPEGLPGCRYEAATIRTLAHLPQAAAVGAVTVYVAALPDADWEFGVYAPEDGIVGDQLARDRVVRGRRPDPARADEIAISEATAKQAHVDVGDVVTLLSPSPEQVRRAARGDEHAFDDGAAGPTLRLRVVGVMRGPSDVVGRSDASILATPAFDARYRGQIAFSSRILVARARPGTDPAALGAAIEQALPTTLLGVFAAVDEDAPARSAVHVLALGLVVFAAVAGAAATLVVGQAVARHAASSDTDEETMGALGSTRGQRMRALTATAAPVAAAGAVLAVLTAVVASTWMPVGLARRIEPDPGLQLDLPVVAAGALVVLLVVVVAAGLGAVTRTSRRRAPRRAPRVPVLATSLDAAGAGPVVATGARLALDRRPPALPVRSALFGVGSAIVVVVAASTFSASLDRLAGDPQRWGFDWDLLLDGSADLDALVAGLASEPAVEGVATLVSGYTFVDGDGVRAYGLDPADGAVGYALRSGVQPIGPDEAVIGTETAARLGVDIGDTLEVATCPCSGDVTDAPTSPVRVVGTALFPEDDDGNFDDAVGFSGPGYERHVGTDDEIPRVAVRLVPGARVDGVAARLDARYPGHVSAYSFPEPPGEVGNLLGLRRFPVVLAWFAALLGIAALVHVLVTTLRRRRRDLATLRSIGLTPRQAGRCIVWQSLTTTAMGLVVGLPLGIIAGATAWRVATEGAGVATDARTSPAALALFVAGVIALAAAVGAPVGRFASRHTPAAALRSE